MEFTRPLPYQEALRKIGDKSIVGSMLDSQAWGRLPVAIRERAFFSATVESVRFLQRSRDMLTDFMTGATETVIGPDGHPRTALKVGSRADFVKQASEFAIKEGMGPLDPKDVGTLKDIRSQRRLELIFDIQTQQCYSYANWKEGMDPDTLNEFPAQRFIRVNVVIKERIIHKQNEGVVRLKTDLQFWLGMNSPQIGGFGVPWGPWGFGSGMDVEDVDRDEAEDMGLVKPGEELQPVEKDLNEHLEASLRGLDPDILQIAKDTLGNLIEVDGDRIHWLGSNPTPKPAPQPAPAPVPQPQTPPAAPQPPSPAPAPVNAPVPPPQQPLPAPATPSRKAPVSAAIQNKTRGALKTKIDAALQAIDQVHDDGVLPKVPVSETKKSAYGFINWNGNRNNAVPAKMGIRHSGPWPELTMVHETGHLLDLTAITGKGSVATLTKDAVIQPVIQAIKATAKFKELQAVRAASSSPRQRKFYDYLMTDIELWARAYAQFIAIKSPSAELKRQLQSSLQQEPHKQWTDADFAPVQAEIETLFKKLGWI